MKVSEFSQRFPEYSFDFDVQLRAQPRVFDGAILDQFPVELEPDQPYQAGSRGRPNLNQTLTHSQCATCQRVLRNDYYYTLPSMMKRNMVFSHCRECNQEHNAGRYERRAEVIHARRQALWSYLAPRCAACGFDKHISALDLHHPQNKEAMIAELVTSTIILLDPGRVEALLREAAKCVPLCSNCHRMVHAGALHLPDGKAEPNFRIAELIKLLQAAQ